MIKPSLVLLTLCNLCFLVGCWDRSEINDIAIITATALDYSNENEIELSVEIVIPESMSAMVKEGGGSGARSTFVESAIGETLADARSNLQTKVARTLFWGHSESTVIGEKLAEHGIKEHLDFFSRMPETRFRNVVYVSQGKAKEIISSLPHLEDTASETLHELAQFESGLHITMKDLFQMLKSQTGETTLPLIKVVQTKEEGKMKDKTQLIINGAALFKEDKMIGTMDQVETRGILWIRNEIKTATVTINIEDGEGKGKVSLEMIRSSTELQPSIENGRWKMKIIITTEDDIIQNASNFDMRSPDIIHKIKMKAEKDIEDRVKQAVSIVKDDKKVDILTFGESFRRKYPKEWQKVKDKWEERFPEIEVEYDVTVKVLRPGEATEPPAVPDDKVKEG